MKTRSDCLTLRTFLSRPCVSSAAVLSAKSELRCFSMRTSSCVNGASTGQQVSGQGQAVRWTGQLVRTPGRPMPG